ncbi:DNA-binding protein [Ochrobactrum soli]|uniref:helix-turn-helix domain-containing protein n=1 Tax=Ochrobactrum soli TaxID=2448455 RepID=UPI000EF27F1E|nr:DNA-binding protein [[Ochrobactrum] soli]
MTHQYAYRPEDVAKLWGCSSRQIRNMINSGQLEAFRVGKLLRITPAAVEEYERRNTVSVKIEEDTALSGERMALADALRIRRQTREDRS